jgi:hypothetical protein
MTNITLIIVILRFTDSTIHDVSEIIISLHLVPKRANFPGAKFGFCKGDALRLAVSADEQQGYYGEEGTHRSGK